MIMNKKLQAAIGLMFLMSSAIGQTSEELLDKKTENIFTPKSYVTPIINLVNSSLYYGSDNSSVADYKKRNFGLQAGVSVQTVISSNFSVLSEFYYMRKGGKLKANNPLTSKEISYRFNNVELPVLARLHLGRAHVNVGPSIAYTLSGSEKTEDQSKAMSFEETNQGFKRFEAGIGMGGGYTFPSKRKQFMLDIRYNHGLTNISYNQEMYNRSIVVSLMFIKLSN
jgi:hypothetical protein